MEPPPARPIVTSLRPSVLATVACAAALAAACAPPAAARRPAARAVPVIPAGAAGRADTLAPGVVHARFVVPESEEHGRWAVNVLRTAPGACVAALKAGAAAVGRAPTSTLAAALAQRDTAAVVGAVNADFFSFTPPGVPTSAHVSAGRVVTGPTRRPVFAVDSARRPWIGTLVPSAIFVRDDADTLVVTGWNRPARDGVAVFDAGWGPRTDSVPGRLFVRLRPVRLFADFRGAAADPGRFRVVSVDSGAATPLGALAYVIAVGPNVPRAVRARWASLRPGTVGTFALGLFPVRPREAVGGFPVLLRRGGVAAEVDSAGDAAFRGRNPRTAVGIAADGGLLLVTVDGRQPGHSDGTTLRETAELLRTLGAVDALNLDGGGSTTMVVRDGRGPGLAVVNRPSDRTGERPVANALAVQTCPAR